MTPNRHLDVGCGIGDLVKFASANGWLAEGIDPSPHMIEVGRHLHPRLAITVGTLETAGAHRWNLVSATGDVVNHLAMIYGPEAALTMLGTVVATGGTLIGDAVLDLDIIDNWEGCLNRYVRPGVFVMEADHRLTSTTPAVGTIERRWWLQHEPDSGPPDLIETETIRGVRAEEIAGPLRPLFRRVEVFDWDTGLALSGQSCRVGFTARERMSP